MTGLTKLSTSLDAEGERQLARVLAALIWASGAVYLFVIVTGLFYGDRVLIALTLVGCALLIIPMVLLRRRRVRASGLAVMLIEVATVTTIATVGQGIRDLAIVTFPIIFIFAGLALERAYFRICVGLTLLAVCWLVFGESLGWFVTKPFEGGVTNWFYLVGTTIILLVAAFAVDLLASNVRGGLQRAQSEIAERKRTEERLEQEKILLRTLIDSLPDRIYAMNVDGTKILSNTADWQASGGKKMEDVIGKTDFDTYPPELAVQFWAVDKQVMDSGEGIVGLEEPALDAEGKSVMTLTSKVPLRNAQGEIIGLVGSGHDITLRKRAESMQTAIHRISQAAIASEGIEELYRSIHSVLGELLPTENFYIAAYDPVNELISFPYFVDQYDQVQPGPTKVQGLTGYVIRTGRSLLATRQVLDRLVREGKVEIIGMLGEDWMGAPLKVEGRTIGVIAAQTYVEGLHFSQEDLNLLEFVSTQVAQAIERKRMEEEIRSLSLTDELTGLYNRRGFSLLAEQAVKVACRIKKNMLLFFFDVDGLKGINDTYGHTHGDLALKEVAAILKETFRGADVAARHGGDEFVVLAVDAATVSADALANRIQTDLEQHNQRGHRSYELTLSVGVAEFGPESPCTVSELIARADALMYEEKQAKKAGK